MTPASPTRRVLLADDDADLVDLLTRRCESLGLVVDSATNAMTALGKIEQDPPDLVVLDVDLPQGNGLSVCEMMTGHDSLRSVPVVILTGSRNQITIKRCHELCAYYVPKSTDIWVRVEPLLKELLGLAREPLSVPSDRAPDESRRGEWRPTSDDLIDSVFAVIGVEDDGAFESDTHAPREDRPWVLSIEDDDDVATALKLRLESHGVRLIRATAGCEGYRKAFFSAPSAILLDYELPNGNGDYVLRRLKETPAVADVPVVVLTGRREASIERQMRGLGAAEFLTKPFNWSDLREALDRHLDLAPMAAPVDVSA